MSKSANKAQRLRLLDEQGWRCFWCKRPVYLHDYRHGRRVPRGAATIDHLDSRVSGGRGMHGGERRRVVACNECNNRRGRDEYVSLLIDEQRRRAGRFPLVATEQEP